MRKLFYVFLSLFLILQISCIKAFANDLDDGISSYTDDKIETEDQLGNKDINVSFIILWAKSQANMETPSVQTLVGQVSSETTAGNINSVIVGPGSVVNGDITVIDSSNAPITQIVAGQSAVALLPGASLLIPPSSSGSSTLSPATLAAAGLVGSTSGSAVSVP